MSRHRSTAQLTLGFLTLGTQAAPLDVIAGAAAAGFGAAGLRISGRVPSDPWPSVDGDPAAFRRIRNAAAAAGVRISSISGYYLTPQTRREHLLANVRAARELGAPLIAQGCFEPDEARAQALLREYAQAAADAGLRIALEFMPMSALRELPQALDWIARSGAPNIGLLIDALHLARSGAGPREVAALDASDVYLAQLCDAPAALIDGSTLYDEAMSGRLYPGEGGLNLAGLVGALPPGAEIELETPVVADGGLPPVLRARRAAERARAFFERRFPPERPASD